MKSLIYLSLTKLKGTIRNQFRTATSAIITTLMILLYGALVVMVFVNSSAYVPETMQISTNMAILAGVGMVALLSVTVILNKRKALVYDTDAHYLFAGPYSRKQVNGYILVQTAVQSLLYGLLACFMMAMLSMKGYFSIPLFLISLLVLSMTFSIFLLATDYIYMWSLVDKKHRMWNYILAALVLVWMGTVLFFSMQRNGYELKNGFLEFALGRDFYSVPFFGWAKQVLNAFVEREYLSMLPGLLLLLACNAVLVILFLGFNKDIAEQAVKDAEEVSEFMRKAKQNRSSVQVEDKKIKKIKGEFPQGARAVFYKNMLIMRKTGNFLRKQDVLIIIIYFLVSYASPKGSRFYMFCYMMGIWLFNLLNDADLLGDLKNYQIYLIPEHPLKKLVYAILPAYLKIAVVISASVLFVGVFNKMPLVLIIQYLVMLLGYGMIFIAGTVLSVRILKSRTNIMLENLLRMLIVLVTAIPSVVVGVLIFVLFKNAGLLMTVMSVTTLVMNFAVSILTIIACQGMMNGREL